jgi:flagellar protein FlaG
MDIAVSNHLAGASAVSKELIPARQSVRATEPMGAEPASKETPAQDNVRQAIASANAALKVLSSSLEFSQDSSTGKTIVRVVDTSNQQVLRQFPSEEMLAIARAVDRFQGWLLKEKA